MANLFVISNLLLYGTSLTMHFVFLSFGKCITMCTFVYTCVNQHGSQSLSTFPITDSHDFVFLDVAPDARCQLFADCS